MKVLSTTYRGDSFERRILTIIESLVKNDEFIVPGKLSAVYWKRDYFSPARGSNITFDITIETFLPRAEKYSILTVIECKDYSGSVPVDDVEEFDAKLGQLSHHNVKGIIVTSSTFQKSALNLAKSRGIGLIRINAADELDWINYRKDRNSENIAVSDVAERLSSARPANFIGLVDNRACQSLPELLITLGILDNFTPSPSQIRIPYVSLDKIQNLIEDLPTISIYKSGKLDTSALMSHLSEAYGVKFETENELGIHGQVPVLGKLTYDPLAIHISKSLQLNIYRWRFTLAHEVGHLLLHYDLLKNYLDESSDFDNSLAFEKEFSETVNRNMEVQANMFASTLLLPEEPLRNEVYSFFRDENIYKGYLWYDTQRVNVQLVYNLLVRIKQKFQVSKESAKYRLMGLGLIRSEIWNRLFDDHFKMP